MPVKISWAVLACLALCAAAARAQEPAVPWLLQPLQPPSPLRLSQLELRLDYTRRERPEWVWMHFHTRITNDSSDPVSQPVMFVTADPDASFRFEGKPLMPERLVMPLALSPRQPKPVTTRVSVVRLILLGKEQADLDFEGFQRIEFTSLARHKAQFILPMSRAWKSVEDTRVELRLAPELRLLSNNWVKQNQRYVHTRGKYADGPLEVQLEAPLQSDGSLHTVVGAVPALRHIWLWGLAAALLALLPGLLWRPLWWLAPLVALGLHEVILRGLDPVCAQWTWYRGARGWQAALHAYRWYVVPGLALLGALTGLWLTRVRNRQEGK